MFETIGIISRGCGCWNSARAHRLTPTSLLIRLNTRRFVVAALMTSDLSDQLSIVKRKRYIYIRCMYTYKLWLPHVYKEKELLKHSSNRSNFSCQKLSISFTSQCSHFVYTYRMFTCVKDTQLHFDFRYFIWKN